MFVARARAAAASAAGQQEKGVDPPGGKRNPKRVMVHGLFTNVRTIPYGPLGVLGNPVVSSSWKLEPAFETTVTIPRDTLGTLGTLGARP